MFIWKFLFKCITTGLSFLLLVWPFSPKPACWLLRNAFRFGTLIRPKEYATIRSRVKIVRDLCYDIKNKFCTLDIVLPAEQNEPLPVIFWAHGGAYVGGDKRDVEEYVVMLAARGYAVVNLNYPLAPEFCYPAGVLSIASAYSFIQKHATEYSIDLTRVYFAGDSAGAQMSAQFVNAQVDEDDARRLGLLQTVPYETIRGVILFCGLYDAPAYAARFHHTPVAYVVHRVFWGVTGNRNWPYGEEIRNAAVLHHIPEQFPAVFLTDGNSDSFLEQCEAYAAALQDSSADVECVAYPRKRARLQHEYQFHLHKQEALETFDRLCAFLDRTNNSF